MTSFPEITLSLHTGHRGCYHRNCAEERGRLCIILVLRPWSGISHAWQDMDEGSDTATSLDVCLSPLCQGPTSDLHPPHPLDFVKPAADNGPDADNLDQCWSIYSQSIWYHGWPHSPRAERIHPALQPNLLKERSSRKWSNVSNILVGTVLRPLDTSIRLCTICLVINLFTILLYCILPHDQPNILFFHVLPPNCPKTCKWCEIVLNIKIISSKM